MTGGLLVDIEFWTRVLDHGVQQLLLLVLHGQGSLLSPEGLLRGFGENHCNSKSNSLTGSLLVRFIFSLWTPSLLPVAEPPTRASLPTAAAPGEEAADGGKCALPHLLFSPKGNPILVKAPQDMRARPTSALPASAASSSHPGFTGSHFAS